MRILSALALFALPFYAFAESIDVGSFNLESGGAELDDLTTQIEAYSGIDVWGYSEVSESWEEDVAISSFLDEGVASTSFLSETGGADRLLIVFNSERFTVLDNGELTNLNIGGNVRGALWVKLKGLTE